MVEWLTLKALQDKFFDRLVNPPVGVGDVTANTAESAFHFVRNVDGTNPNGGEPQLWVRNPLGDWFAVLCKWSGPEIHAMSLGSNGEMPRGYESLGPVIPCERDAMAADLNRLGAMLNKLTDEIISLRALAQKTADRECAYLREIGELKRRLALPEEPGSHDYSGPVKDGRATPDPIHERFHHSIGDVLAGRVMPDARRQMQEALKSVPREKPPFPGSPTGDPRRMGLA